MCLRAIRAKVCPGAISPKGDRKSRSGAALAPATSRLVLGLATPRRSPTSPFTHSTTSAYPAAMAAAALVTVPWDPPPPPVIETE
jgi:hypothetical protein